MSRSGYSDDYEQWSLIRWRGAVASAIKGKRGQEFLYEMLHALAALPDRKLIAHDLEKDGAVCALGALGKARGLDMSGVDPEDHEAIAAFFGIPHALACEVMYWNDEDWPARHETTEERFARMRQLIENNLRTELSSASNNGD